MAKRHFLQLAHDFKSGYARKLVSEKLDGQRCFWDGGVSRGLHVSEVPYANTAKDERFIDQNRRATGLWSRYGHPIFAPDWFVDQFPRYLLDGELWMGRNTFQKLRSVVSTLVPNEEAWRQVRFLILDKPAPQRVFADGLVEMNNGTKVKFDGVFDWYLKRKGLTKGAYFQLNGCLQNYAFLQTQVFGPSIKVHDQYETPDSEEDAEELVKELLDKVCDGGGEGLIIREPHHIWLPERTHAVNKIKKLQDAEGTVIGYTTGRETDKGSKHRGRMGALIIDFHGKRLELSGFTDNQRQLSNHDWAWDNPGVDCLDSIENPLFPRGTVVTFRYRELTDGGLPKEARFWRKRDE